MRNPLRICFLATESLAAGPVSVETFRHGSRPARTSIDALETRAVEGRRGGRLRRPQRGRAQAADVRDRPRTGVSQRRRRQGRVVRPSASWSSPTGPATSTRAGTPRARLRSSRTRPGSPSPTTSTSTTTPSSTPRSSNQMRACEPIDRDMIILTDWMAAQMINLGCIQPLYRATQVDVKKKLIPALQGVPWDPKRDVLCAVAVRPDRHRLQRGPGAGGRQLRGADHPRGPPRQDHPAQRDERHDGVLPQGRRCRPGRLRATTSGPTPSTS